MTNLRALAFLALLSTFMALPAGCAHIDAVANDIKSCLTSEDQAILKDSEGALVQFAEQTLMCDPTLSPAEMPLCAEQGLAAACEALGPDGERFKECVITKVENDPMAASLPKARAHLMHVKLIEAKRGAGS